MDFGSTVGPDYYVLLQPIVISINPELKTLTAGRGLAGEGGEGVGNIALPAINSLLRI